MRIWTLCVTTCLAACSEVSTQPSASDGNVQAAETLIDAFYSFEPAKLRSALAKAPESSPSILYYQGWAKGGNYAVVDRKPCNAVSTDKVTCSITVKDDLIAALGTGYDVTDTFEISFKDGSIIAVKTSSNDPPQFEQALEWLGTTRPELMEGPCRGFFKDGPTPQECVREVVAGFRDFRSRRAKNVAS